MSTIAIIMTAYNGEKYIAEQIDSILASTYQDFQLFIYDDGSEDATLSILRSYESGNPDKIKVYQNKTNLGVTQNFLQALSRTTADYIMFSDQDDIWKANKAASVLKRMRHMEAQAGKECPIAVFTDATVVDEELNTINASFFCSGHLNPAKTDLAHLLMENKLIGCSVMVNAALRKILQSSMLPKQARYHDWWLALIAAAFGKIGYLNEQTLLYRQHSGNVVGDRGFFSYVLNRTASIGRQREMLSLLYHQAEEFMTLYEDLLAQDKKNILCRFIALEQKGFLMKRYEILCCGFLKTGFLRNVGLMLII